MKKTRGGKSVKMQSTPAVRASISFPPELYETLEQVAKQKKADLIVLGVRQPSGFPGAATHLPIAIAHQVVSRAECPVLTVRG